MIPFAEDLDRRHALAAFYHAVAHRLKHMVQSHVQRSWTYQKFFERVRKMTRSPERHFLDTSDIPQAPIGTLHQFA